MTDILTSALYANKPQTTANAKLECNLKRDHTPSNPTITFRTFLTCQQLVAFVLLSALSLTIEIHAQKHTSL